MRRSWARWARIYGIMASEPLFHRQARILSMVVESYGGRHRRMGARPLLTLGGRHES